MHSSVSQPKFHNKPISNATNPVQYQNQILLSINTNNHFIISGAQIHEYNYIHKIEYGKRGRWFLGFETAGVGMRYHRVEPDDPSTSLPIPHRNRTRWPNLATEFSPIPDRGRPFL
jgi:hypothetical protein